MKIEEMNKERYMEKERQMLYKKLVDCLFHT